MWIGGEESACNPVRFMRRARRSRLQTKLVSDAQATDGKLVLTNATQEFDAGQPALLT